MTSPAFTLELGTTLETATWVLLERHISGAPVIDDTGRPVGIISKTDLLRAREQVQRPTDARPKPEALEDGFHVESADVRTVADVMTPVVFTLPENASVAMAASLMVYEGVHRLPIVSAKGTVSGILTTIDIMRWVAKAERERAHAP